MFPFNEKDEMCDVLDVFLFITLELTCFSLTFDFTEVHRW